MNLTTKFQTSKEQ